MHNRSNPASVEVKERLGNAYTGSEYENLIEDVKRELMELGGHRPPRWHPRRATSSWTLGLGSAKRWNTTLN